MIPAQLPDTIHEVVEEIKIWPRHHPSSSHVDDGPTSLVALLKFNLLHVPEIYTFDQTTRVFRFRYEANAVARAETVPSIMTATCEFVIPPPTVEGQGDMISARTSFTPVTKWGINFAGTVHLTHCGSVQLIYIPGVKTYDPAGSTGDGHASERIGYSCARTQVAVTAAQIMAITLGASLKDVRSIQSAMEGIIRRFHGRMTLFRWMHSAIVNAVRQQPIIPYPEFIQNEVNAGRLDVYRNERAHTRDFLVAFAASKSTGVENPPVPLQYLLKIQQADAGTLGEEVDAWLTAQIDPFAASPRQDRVDDNAPAPPSRDELADADADADAWLWYGSTRSLDTSAEKKGAEEEADNRIDASIVDHFDDGRGGIGIAFSEALQIAMSASPDEDHGVPNLFTFSARTASGNPPTFTFHFAEHCRQRGGGGEHAAPCQPVTVTFEVGAESSGAEGGAKKAQDLVFSFHQRPVTKWGINWGASLEISGHPNGPQNHPLVALLPGERSYDPAGETGDSHASERTSSSYCRTQIAVTIAQIALLRLGGTLSQAAKIQDAMLSVIQNFHGRVTLFRYCWRQLSDLVADPPRTNNNGPNALPYPEFVIQAIKDDALDPCLAGRKHMREFLGLWKSGVPEPPAAYFERILAEDGDVLAPEQRVWINEKVKQMTDKKPGVFAQVSTMGNRAAGALRSAAQIVGDFAGDFAAAKAYERFNTGLDTLADIDEHEDPFLRRGTFDALDLTGYAVALLRSGGEGADVTAAAMSRTIATDHGRLFELELLRRDQSGDPRLCGLGGATSLFATNGFIFRHLSAQPQIHIFALAGDLAGVQRMVHAGAINDENDFGETALHCLSRMLSPGKRDMNALPRWRWNKFVDIALFLLRRGIRASHCDDNGRMATDWIVITDTYLEGERARACELNMLGRIKVSASATPVTAALRVARAMDALKQKEIGFDEDFRAERAFFTGLAHALLAVPEEPISDEERLLLIVMEELYGKKDALVAKKLLECDIKGETPFTVALVANNINFLSRTRVVRVTKRWWNGVQPIMPRVTPREFDNADEEEARLAMLTIQRSASQKRAFTEDSERKEIEDINTEDDRMLTHEIELEVQKPWREMSTTLDNMMRSFGKRQSLWWWYRSWAARLFVSPRLNFATDAVAYAFFLFVFCMVATEQKTCCDHGAERLCGIDESPGDDEPPYCTSSDYCSRLYSEFSSWEQIFGVFLLAFSLKEFNEVLDSDFRIIAHLKEGFNSMDFAIVFVALPLTALRILGWFAHQKNMCSVFGWEIMQPRRQPELGGSPNFVSACTVEFPNLPFHQEEHCYEILDDFEFAFLIGMAVSSILLWLRLLAIAAIDPDLGPLLFCISKMFIDIKNFIKLLCITLFAFTFALNVFVTPGERQMMDDENRESVLEFWSQFKYQVLAFFGEFDLQVFGTMGYTKGWIGGVLQISFLLVTNVILLNLLIGMMGERYAATTQKAGEQYQFLKGLVIRDYIVHNNRLPIPFNLVVQLLCWLILLLQKPYLKFASCWCGNNSRVGQQSLVSPTEELRPSALLGSEMGHNNDYWRCNYCLTKNEDKTGGPREVIHVGASKRMFYSCSYEFCYTCGWPSRPMSSSLTTEMYLQRSMISLYLFLAALAPPLIISLCLAAGVFCGKVVLWDNGIVVVARRVKIYMQADDVSQRLRMKQDRTRMVQMRERQADMNMRQLQSLNSGGASQLSLDSAKSREEVLRKRDAIVMESSRRKQNMARVFDAVVLADARRLTRQRSSGSETMEQLRKSRHLAGDAGGEREANNDEEESGDDGDEKLLHHFLQHSLSV